MKPKLILSGLLGLALALCVAPWNAPAASLLEIWTSAGVDFEGRPQFELRWNAESNATYRIQHRSSLAPNVPWKTMDVVRSLPGGGQQTYLFPQIDPAGGFFRLLLPDPEIFSIEPARFGLGGSVEFHVVGQLFGPDMQLRASPLTLSNVEIIHSGLMRGSFTPPVAGTYVFELVRAGMVLSSFQVECFDAAAPPPSVLQEPPDEPWASPMRVRSVPNDPATKGTFQTRSPRVTPSGEVELDEVDLFIPGRGLDFIWGRRYRSRSGTNTLQGNRWDYSYNVSARQVAGGIEVRDGMGREDVFAQAADGTFVRDEHFSVGTLTGTVFRLTFADTGFWEFLPFDGSPAAGKLARIVDRNSNTMSMEYDVPGRLARVIDTLGRTNTIQYILGKIFAVADFTGRGVIYTYYSAVDPNGAAGDLKTVISPAVTNTPNGNDFPAGKTTTYTYSRGFTDPRENSLLLTITDPKGQLAQRHVYQHNQTDLQFLRCISRQVGNSNGVLTYNYLPQTPSPSNAFVTQKIIVNDRVGNVSERSFDARHRLLLLRDFSGRAIPGLHVSETTNRPMNKLRASDPDFFETRFEWNNDSLCTRVVHPRGNEALRLHEREFDPAAGARKKGDLRVLRENSCCPAADVDRDGLPDLASRVWQFDYDPLFGSPAGHGGKDSRPAGAQGGLTLCEMLDIACKGGNAAACDAYKSNPDCSGPPKWPPNRSSGPGGVGSWLIVPRRITDPRGNVTTSAIDIRGNLIRRSDPFVAGNDPPVVEFSYNSFGQLTGVTNAPDGQGRRRVDTLAYHSSGPQAGYLASTRRDDGGLNLLTSCEYDARGNVTRRIDARGSDELFTYNALDQVVRTQSRPHVLGTNLRLTTDYFYDGNDNIVRVDRENQDEAGTLDPANSHWTSLCQYDVLDRLTLVAHEFTGTSSLSNRFHYNANGNLTQVDHPEAVSGADPNNVVTHTYDERDLLLESVAAPGTGLGATNGLDYDANGNCTKARKETAEASSARSKTFEYDGLDRLARVIDAMGNEDLFTRNANDDLVRHRLMGELTDVPGSAGNRRLAETRYEYDALNRLTRTREAFFDSATGQDIGDGEATSTFTYAPNRLRLSDTDDNGRTTRYTYDTADRLASVTDPGSNAVSFAYDANGNVLTRAQMDRSDLGGDPLAFTVILEYDHLDRRISASDNVGNNVNWGFNSQDNIVRHTDPRGNDTRYEYDGLSRLTRTTHFDGQAAGGIIVNSSRADFRNNRRVSSTDGNSNTTFYAYDSLDRRTMVTSPDGNVHTFHWDAFGNLAGGQDANGTVISNSFDLLDRCVRKDTTPAQGVATTTTFEEFSYDGVFRPVRAANEGFVHTFVWDSRSNARQQSQTAGGVTLVSTATFDGVGNRLSLTHPSGRGVSSTFDALDRPAAVSLTAGGPVMQLATFAYDGPDRLARIARANGIETLVQWNGSQTSPNAPGDFGWQQVASVNHQLSGGGASIDTRTLAYDRAQNKTLRAQTAPFSVGGLLRSNVWVHDALNRLSSSDFFVGNNPPSTRDYQLDPNGNRQAVLDNGQPAAYQMDNILPEPGDFQMNQYTDTPFGTHQYDRNGNLVATIAGNRRLLYEYDYADRLVSVQESDGQTITPVADYAYDALGRRASTTLHLPPPMAPLTNRFFHDADGAIIEERVAGILTRSYVIPEIGDEVLVAFTAGGQAQYYHGDDLGNVLALTDAAGNVIERYDYDDYGMPRFLDANGDPLVVPPGVPATESPAGNPFLFHGMFWDPDTALYSGEFDPATGRYIMRSGAADDGNNFNWDFSGRTFAGDNPWSFGHSEAEFFFHISARRNVMGGLPDGPAFLIDEAAPACGATHGWPVKWSVSELDASKGANDSGASGLARRRAYFPNPAAPINPGAIALGDDGRSSRAKITNAPQQFYRIKGRLAGGGGGAGGSYEVSAYWVSQSNRSTDFPNTVVTYFGLYTQSRASGGWDSSIDYNSSRSNKSNAIAPPGGGGGGGGSPGGIIGILASMAIPSYDKYQRRIAGGGGAGGAFHAKGLRGGGNGNDGDIKVIFATKK